MDYGVILATYGPLAGGLIAAAIWGFSKYTTVILPRKEAAVEAAAARREAAETKWSLIVEKNTESHVLLSAAMEAQTSTLSEMKGQLQRISTDLVEVRVRSGLSATSEK